MTDHTPNPKSPPGFWKNKPDYKPMLFIIAGNEAWSF